MLGELTGQQEPHGGLHLPGGDGGTLVVVRQAGSLRGDAFEDVVHERVHDRHGLAGDTGVGVHLLQHLVDVDGVALLPLVLLLFLVRLGDVLLGLAGFLGGLSASLGWHVERTNVYKGDRTLTQRLPRGECNPTNGLSPLYIRLGANVNCRRTDKPSAET